MIVQSMQRLAERRLGSCADCACSTMALPPRRRSSSYREILRLISESKSEEKRGYTENKPADNMDTKLLGVDKLV
jgi:hypothetical protein